MLATYSMGISTIIPFSWIFQMQLQQQYFWTLWRTNKNDSKQWQISWDPFIGVKHFVRSIRSYNRFSETIQSCNRISEPTQSDDRFSQNDSKLCEWLEATKVFAYNLHGNCRLRSHVNFCNHVYCCMLNFLLEVLDF